MEYRSGKQCRERYINQLDPAIKKTTWEHEEDAIIKKMHMKFGKKWSKFMDLLPGRSDNAIKNRYHIICRDNFSNHNLNSKMKALEGAKLQAVTFGNDSFVPEDNAVRLAHFQFARSLLNQKIDSLELEQELFETHIAEGINSSFEHPFEMLTKNGVDSNLARALTMSSVKSTGTPVTSTTATSSSATETDDVNSQASSERMKTATSHKRSHSAIHQVNEMMEMEFDCDDWVFGI